MAQHLRRKRPDIWCRSAQPAWLPLSGGNSGAAAHLLSPAVCNQALVWRALLQPAPPPPPPAAGTHTGTPSAHPRLAGPHERCEPLTQRPLARAARGGAACTAAPLSDARPSAGVCVHDARARVGRERGAPMRMHARAPLPLHRARRRCIAHAAAASRTPLRHCARRCCIAHAAPPPRAPPPLHRA
ncbi:hypothetical protein JKP88DRAFT_7746, partial [Tribonema minus]